MTVTLSVSESDVDANAPSQLIDLRNIYVMGEELRFTAILAQSVKVGDRVRVYGDVFYFTGRVIEVSPNHNAPDIITLKEVSMHVNVERLG